MSVWERHQVDPDDRCIRCKSIAYCDLWSGEYKDGEYTCSTCLTTHIHGDLNREIERLRWENIKLTQRNKDLEQCLLTALAAQRES